MDDDCARIIIRFAVQAARNTVVAFRQAYGPVVQMDDGLPVRLPWPANFHDVVIHTDLCSRDGHSGLAEQPIFTAIAAAARRDE